jgi:endogenous inhibitor of DNA gyrase (YacG/DUF329 family)
MIKMRELVELVEGWPKCCGYTMRLERTEANVGDALLDSLQEKVALDPKSGATVQRACPTCGSPVRVVRGDEGTSHYEPCDSRECDRLRAFAEWVVGIEGPAGTGAAGWLTMLPEISRRAKEALGDG